MDFYETTEAQRSARIQAERERAWLLSQVERMPDLPRPPGYVEPPPSIYCSVCGRELTHPNQYRLSGTKKKPIYRCRRKSCSPRRKRKTQAAPTRTSAHPKRTIRRRGLFNLFGLL